MLPFLKNTNQDGASSSPIDSIKRNADDGSDYDSMESCAEDVLNAIQSKNKKLLAQALRAAFELCDSEPHEEGPHV